MSWRTTKASKDPGGGGTKGQVRVLLLQWNQGAHVVLQCITAGDDVLRVTVLVGCQWQLADSYTEQGKAGDE